MVERMADCRWSSYASYVYGTKGPHCLRSDPLLYTLTALKTAGFVRLNTLSASL